MPMRYRAPAGPGNHESENANLWLQLSLVPRLHAYEKFALEQGVKIRMVGGRTSRPTREDWPGLEETK
jgi:hypothetical protein